MKSTATALHLQQAEAQQPNKMLSRLTLVGEIRVSTPALCVVVVVAASEDVTLPYIALFKGIVLPSFMTAPRTPLHMAYFVFKVWTTG